MKNMPWFTTKGQICQLLVTFSALCLAGFKAWPDMRASAYFTGGAILFYALIALVIGAIVHLIIVIRKGRPLNQVRKADDGAASALQEKYEASMRSSAHWEGRCDLTQKQLTECEKDLEKAIAEVHRRGSEIERCRVEIEELRGKLEKPKLTILLLHYEIEEIVSSEPAFQLPMGGRQTNNQIMIKASIRISNEHRPPTRVCSIGLIVYDHTVDDWGKRCAEHPDVDPALFSSSIQFGLPIDAAVSFAVKQTDALMVVKSKFEVTVQDGTGVRFNSPPETIYNVTQRAVLPSQLPSIPRSPV
jgi:hypothetical protein